MAISDHDAIGDLPPGVVQEGAAFQRLRTTIMRAILDEAFTQSRLRTMLLIVLSLIFWAGLFWLFFEGFQFLRITLTADSMRSQIVHAIFNTFFFTLTFMIALSAAIVLYGGLFRSRETGMLLTFPVRPERIVLYKYQETVFISCWGFILLGTPLLLAYGLVNQAPWYYFVLLGPFMVAFVIIPTSLGALACLFVAYAMPQVRKQAISIAGAVVLVLMGWFLWQAYVASNQHTLTPAWVKDMLTRLRFTEHYVFPSWWLSTGLLEAARPQPPAGSHLPGDSILFLCALISNALLLQLCVGFVARRTFRLSFSRLQGLLPTQQAAKVVFADRWLLWLLGRFSPLSRALMLKDVRLFRRDPVLWAQFLIFVGLLTFYVISLQRFEETAANFTPWLTVMGFMNVGVVALIYSTFATRFILPIISLEGRAFWVLGTAPIDREHVITSKFLLASVVSIPFCLAIIITSDFMLPVARRFPLLAFVHAVAVAVLCITLSALAVGNGARFPNLRESSPSRIASGFGGTLNLVESGLTIIFFLFAIGLPGYFWVAQQDWNARAELGPLGLGSATTLVAGLSLASVLSLLASWLALRMGRRHFAQLEA